MPSERRLHPFSVLFAFLSQIRTFILPGVLVMIGASSRGGDDWWQPWMMALVIPNAIVAVIRYVTYRFRYDPNELVIHSGLVFRRERHIPYGRIQNIDAVQNVLHRLLNVVEVRIETGGGQTPEATMSVLPVSAFQEMRARVFAERQALAMGEPAVEASPTVAETPGSAVLLELPPKELLLCGFLENRGGVLIAAGLGLAWEIGLMDRLMSRFGNQLSGRRMVRDLARGIFSNAEVAFERIALSVIGFIGLLFFVRILSMVWALARLYGFRLSLAAGDLRSEVRAHHARGRDDSAQANSDAHHQGGAASSSGRPRGGPGGHCRWPTQRWQRPRQRARIARAHSSARRTPHVRSASAARRSRLRGGSLAARVVASISARSQRLAGHVPHRSGSILRIVWTLVAAACPRPPRVGHRRRAQDHCPPGVGPHPRRRLLSNWLVVATSEHRSPGEDSDGDVGGQPLRPSGGHGTRAD